MIFRGRQSVPLLQSLGCPFLLHGKTRKIETVSASSSQLFTLGLDSQFGTVQGVIQAAVDLRLFPESVRKEFQTGQTF